VEANLGTPGAKVPSTRKQWVSVCPWKQISGAYATSYEYPIRTETSHKL